jgi:hypothetical protein
MGDKANMGDKAMHKIWVDPRTWVDRQCREKTAADTISLFETPGVTPKRVQAIVGRALVIAIALDKLPPPKNDG